MKQVKCSRCGDLMDDPYCCNGDWCGCRGMGTGPDYCYACQCVEEGRPQRNKVAEDRLSKIKLDVDEVPF